jgi:hypothetical protein
MSYNLKTYNKIKINSNLKLQFAIGFSLNLREKRERREAMRERRKKRVRSYNLEIYTAKKKINCKLNYLQLSFLLREKRERRRG